MIVEIKKVQARIVAEQRSNIGKARSTLDKVRESNSKKLKTMKI